MLRRYLTTAVLALIHAWVSGDAAQHRLVQG